jgi:hypothetical protein
MSVEEFAAVMTRRLLAARERSRRIDPPDADVSRQMWPEAVCNGVLSELGGLAADRLAAARRSGLDDHAPVRSPAADVLVQQAMTCRWAGMHTLGADSIASRAARVLRLDETLGQLTEHTADAAAVDRCLKSHLLDWLQVGGDELAFATEGAAREARLLITDDGLPLQDVATRARVSISPRLLTLDEAPADARAAIIAAAPGELAGPWHEEVRWRMLRVDRKEPPSASAPQLRARATEEIIRDVLDRTLAGRLRWTSAV